MLLCSCSKPITAHEAFQILSSSQGYRTFRLSRGMRLNRLALELTHIQMMIEPSPLEERLVHALLDVLRQRYASLFQKWRTGRSSG
jgi:hypothetical protein